MLSGLPVYKSEYLTIEMISDNLNCLSELEIDGLLLYQEEVRRQYADYCSLANTVYQDIVQKIYDYLLAGYFEGNVYVRNYPMYSLETAFSLLKQVKKESDCITAIFNLQQEQSVIDF